MPVARHFANSDLAEMVDVASGLVLKTSHVNKFGYNTSVGGIYESITDLGTINLPDTAYVVSIVSSSSDDTSTGTGARTVEIQGLDANYDLQTVTVTMNGQSAVSTTETFIRIFRMRVATAGSVNINVGNITASLNSVNTARIVADQGQTLMATYTIPNNHTGYLVKFQGSLSKNQEANFRLLSRPSGNGWNVKGVWGTFAESVNYDYPVPLKFDAKTDLIVEGKAGATSEMGAIFDLILVKD